MGAGFFILPGSINFGVIINTLFADHYIETNVISQRLIDAGIRINTRIILVIPCYREPEIMKTLESLWSCRFSGFTAEVIVVINEPEGSPDETTELNRQTLQQVIDWEKRNDSSRMTLYPVYPTPFPKKFAGAGMARKMGMDEAVRRFNQLDQPDGIIVSLDADTLVDPNYLAEIGIHFDENPKHIAATIRFQHRVEELIDPKQAEGIKLYEKYLHYYKEAVEYTGYPFSMFTIGSAFCVKAGAYVKQGGMNRRQAGEDFYFLHKLSKLGAIGEINPTCVYPSARLSDRVPFGTGPALQKWMNGTDDLLMTYCFQAFLDLKHFFDVINSFYKVEKEGFHLLLKHLPEPVSAFLIEDEFFPHLQEINQNVSTPESFRKRFFQKFDAFKILKYLNFVHERFYKKQDIFQAHEQLFTYKHS